MPGMPPPIDLDLADAVDIYLDRCEAEGFVISTLATYLIALRQFVAFAERQGHTSTSDLNLQLALAWQRHLRTKKVSGRGRRRGARSRRNLHRHPPNRHHPRHPHLAAIGSLQPLDLVDVLSRARSNRTNVNPMPFRLVPA